MPRKRSFGPQILMIGSSTLGKKMSTPSESVMNRREEPTSPTECLWASLAAVESGLSKHGVPSGQNTGKHAGKLGIASAKTKRYGEFPTFVFTRESHQNPHNPMT